MVKTTVLSVLKDIRGGKTSAVNNVRKMRVKESLMEKDKLIEKIQKMLNLGDPSRNSYENEVQNALRLAKKLMAENDISMAEVQAIGGKREAIYDFESRDAHSGSLSGWEMYVAPVVALVTSTKVMRKRKYDGKSTIIFCGTPTDVAIAVEMYSIIHRMVKGRAAVYSNPSENHTAYRSYAEGFVQSLWEKAQEKIDLEDESKNKSYALVVASKSKELDAWYRKSFKLKTSLAKRGRVDTKAFSTGRVDGEKVSLRTHGVLC